MLNLKITTVSVALFSAVTFVLCILYGLVVPRAFHGTPLLEMLLPGFRWLSLGSFVLGLVESLILGAYLGAVFTVVHNWTARQLGASRLSGGRHVAMVPGPAPGER